MNLKKIIAIGAVAASTLVAVAPANAVVVTFAGFSAVTNGNVVFRNNGTGGTNATYTSNGTGGTLFTTSSAQTVRPGLAVAGGVATTFSFLNALSGFVTNAPSTFTLNATVTNSPVLTLSGFKIQQALTGTFSFVSTTPLNSFVGIKPLGSSLLSATFSSTSILGQSNGTTGTFGGSTSGGSSVVFTSDFLDFTNANDLGMSLSLDSLISLVSGNNVGLNNATGRALRSFRATASGNFSADPAPRVPGIPEPQIWGLLVVGFGMVGVSVRRRSRNSVVA